MFSEGGGDYQLTCAEQRKGDKDGRWVPLGLNNVVQQHDAIENRENDRPCGSFNMKRRRATATAAAAIAATAVAAATIAAAATTAAAMAATTSSRRHSVQKEVGEGGNGVMGLSFG